MTQTPRYSLSKISQICVVVDDLKKTIERYHTLFGVGPWRLQTIDSNFIPKMTYKGRPANYTAKCALAKIGQIVLEVIEPVEGENIYSDFLAAHGPGMQHVGVYVDNIDEAIGALRAEGYEVLMEGRGYGKDGEGAFAYMGTERDLATVFELIVAPKEVSAPEATYP